MDRRKFIGAATALGAGGGMAFAGGAGALASGVCESAGDPADAAGGRPVRAGTWAASPYRLAGTSVGGRTARFVVHTSLGGAHPRIRLSNMAGAAPVTVDRAFLGRHAGDGAVAPGTNMPVTFGGATAVTLAPGAEALSDPVEMTVAAQSDLAISLYLAGVITDVTGHSIAAQRSYLSIDGDHAADETATSYSTPISSWYLIDEVTVEVPGHAGTLVCLGDSITDGVGSVANTNQRWPDFLARRLLAASRPLSTVGVLNAGIAGNRVLWDTASPNSQARLARDVLSHPGVYAVILFEGINDIASGRARTPGDLIAAYRQIGARLRAHGIRLLCGTITPWLGSASYTEEKESIRVAVNTAIRQECHFDAFIDFDRALRDPEDAKRMLAAYDSGGGVHPNPAGYRAMAETIDLKLLHPSSLPTHPPEAVPQRLETGHA